MGEIKPGILAIVHGLVVHAEDNGKMVEVERWLNHGDNLTDKHPNGRYGGNGAWLCVADSLTIDNGAHGFACIAGKNLLPINPEADPLEQAQQQEQAA